MTFQIPIPLYSTVEVLPGFEALGFSAGAQAVILDVYHSPSLAYEVEVVGDNGQTLHTGGIPAEAVKVVEIYKDPEEE